MKMLSYYTRQKADKDVALASNTSKVTCLQHLNRTQECMHLLRAFQPSSLPRGIHVKKLTSRKLEWAEALIHITSPIWR